jgi:hypothetical protein
MGLQQIGRNAIASIPSHIAHRYQGWTPTRQGRVGVELGDEWRHDPAVITDITMQRERRRCTREFRKAAGSVEQGLDACHHPPPPRTSSAPTRRQVRKQLGDNNER